MNYSSYVFTLYFVYLILYGIVELNLDSKFVSALIDLSSIMGQSQQRTDEYLSYNKVPDVNTSEILCVWQENSGKLSD
jgi:hypothetical protein